MKVTFFGVRGSIPVPGPNTARYGGNTSCIEMQISDDQHFIFDAGTGIRQLGDNLMKMKKDVKSSLFITHTHWDHIHGFPFFVPNYLPSTQIDVYGPFHFNKKLSEVFALQMDYAYFPISAAQLLAKIQYHDLNETQFNVGEVEITTKIMNHPVLCLGYRVAYGGKTVIYTGDNEPYYNVLAGEDEDEEERRENEQIVKESNQRVVDFVKGVDLLICDSQYTPEEYESHRGWGHSTWEDAVNLAINAEVKKLCLFHHEVTRSDDEMDIFLADAQKCMADKGSDIPVLAAMEGQSIEV